MRKILLAVFALFLISSAASAVTNYWVGVDKTSGGTYMNVRVLYTKTDIPPNKTVYGKDIEISSGPYTSKMDATSNCNNAAKAARKNDYLVKNYCSQAIQGQ